MENRRENSEERASAAIQGIDHEHDPIGKYSKWPPHLAILEKTRSLVRLLR
jgi:hypothetical protein